VKKGIKTVVKDIEARKHLQRSTDPKSDNNANMAQHVVTVTGANMGE
jgi:hypothetical protein